MMINVCESLSMSSARLSVGLTQVIVDQSTARLARLIIGYVGGCVHAEGSARELILYTYTFDTFLKRDTFLGYRVSGFEI